MQNNWFECKIRFEKTLENGLQKKVTEAYLVDALSHAEAEARIIGEMRPYMQGEFEVTGVRRANYSELFWNDSEAADKWYRCKLIFITLDERTGVEKKTACNNLVQAADLREAISHLDNGMKGTLVDYIIASVAETAIMDVYTFKGDSENS